MKSRVAMKRSKAPVSVLIIIMLLAQTIPIVRAVTQFVDDYENEDNIAIKSNIVRNSTLDAMQLNYTSGSVVIEAPFQIREHDRSAYYPIMVYSKTATYLQCASGTTSLGYSWWFVVCDTSWLHGKWFRVYWYDTGYSYQRVRLYDGSYNRSSMVDFPNNAGILLKGNGFLGDVCTVDNALETDDVQLDTSGASLDQVTLFFLLSDSWTAQVMTLRVYWFEINEGSGGSGNIFSWDFSTAGTTLTMEQTGTYNDYGRLDGGDIDDIISGGYEEEGYLYTTEVLSGISGRSTVLLTNSTLNNGEISVAFSSDNSTWVNHNNESGYETLAGGYESFDLRDLNFTTLYMRYNFSRGGLQLTPYLYQVRVITIPDEFVDDYTNEDDVAIKEDMIRNSTLNVMELNYSTANIMIKEYQNTSAVSGAFQWRQHRIWGGSPPQQYLEFVTNAFREACGVVSSYRVAQWFFITVDREWLDGKYVRFRWYKWAIGFTGGVDYTWPRFRVYDGEYNRSSFDDFPVSAVPVTKGSGGLVLDVWQQGYAPAWYVRDFLIDTSSCNQTWVTLMWADWDYHTSLRLGVQVDYIQINGASGGASNIWTSDFDVADHNLVLELSGSYNDYGLFNATEGYSSGGYETDGYFYTSEVLDGLDGNSLDLLTNTTLDSGVITLEFSVDNSTWVDHNNQSGYETLTGGYESFDLRDLNVTTLYMRFNFSRGGVLQTPRLYQIRALYEGEVVIITNLPHVDAIIFNTTVGGRVCGVYGVFSDVEGLSGYIFWNNASSPPGGVNSSFTSLSGTSDSALENITLPDVDIVVAVRYYVNDTSDNWAIYIIDIDFNETVEGEGCEVLGTFVDEDGLSGYIFWNNVTNPPTGVNSSFTSLTGTSDEARENITLPTGGSVVAVRYFVNDTENNWVTTLVSFPAADPIVNVTGTWVDYNFTSISTVVGTNSGGNTLNNTYWQDCYMYNVTETTGAPGLNVEFNVSDLPDGLICLSLRTWICYDGSDGHVFSLQAWNYTGSAWVTVSDIPDECFQWINGSLACLAGDFVQNGLFQGRFYHSSPGNVNHEFSLDYGKLRAFAPTDAAVGGTGWMLLQIIAIIIGIVCIAMWLESR